MLVYGRLALAVCVCVRRCRGHRAAWDGDTLCHHPGHTAVLTALGELHW